MYGSSCGSALAARRNAASGIEPNISGRGDGRIPNVKPVIVKKRGSNVGRVFGSAIAKLIQRGKSVIVSGANCADSSIEKVCNVNLILAKYL